MSSNKIVLVLTEEELELVKNSVMSVVELVSGRENFGALEAMSDKLELTKDKSTKFLNELKEIKRRYRVDYITIKVPLLIFYSWLLVRTLNLVDNFIQGE